MTDAPEVTFWAGPIYCEAGTDPDPPRPGVYFLVVGTVAHTLADFAFSGSTRNKSVLPVWERGAAAIQFEILGQDKPATKLKTPFFQAFTFYGSSWKDAVLPQIKLKKIKDPRRWQFGAGISLTFYLPLIWFVWDGRGFEIDNYYSDWAAG